jgi:polysaccharide biosynthesis protein PelG
MAGIGFTLKKALNEANRSGKWRVYVSAAFVAAGPWLITLISLFLLLYWGRGFGMSDDQRDLFFATVTYAMIGSNLISTTAQFFLTRYLADALYVEAPERLLSAFVGTYACTGVASLLLAGVLQAFLPLALPYKIWTVVLTVLLTQLGLMMILLSAAKAYRDIARGFLLGLLSLVAGALAYGFWLKAAGGAPDETTVLALFTIGQGITLMWLGGVVVRDFPGYIPTLYRMGPQYRRYPELLLIGLLYAVSLWVDNGMYWKSDWHAVVADSYFLAPGYDLAKFWTFLTFVPAFTVFSVSIETEFYLVFRRFYNAIERGDTLAPIRVFEEELRAQTKAALMKMTKVQAFVALVAWVLASQLQGRCPDVVDAFQWTAIGSIPHMVWITVFLLLLYFDARKQALWAAFTAVLSLFAGAGVAIDYGWTPGTGYLLGMVIALVIALVLLNRQVERLLYFAFYDPNGVRKRALPPAAIPSEQQVLVGYPILEPEGLQRLEELEEEQRSVRWEPGMKVPSRMETYGRGKRRKSGKTSDSVDLRKREDER